MSMLPVEKTSTNIKSDSYDFAEECIPGKISNVDEPQNLFELYRILKALGDPVRLKLVSLILQSSNHEACLCNLNLSFNLSQPTLSHHLKILKDTKVLIKTKRANWSYFSVNPILMDLIVQMFDLDLS